MATIIDLFWEIFESVGGGTGNITDALNSIAKSDRAKIENYFTNVVDQAAYSTDDYNRLRKFLIDLFATHRSIATSSLQASDPHSISNSDLDELFRSFGYPHSTQLKGFDENPLEQKIQFFLDLVNLYKVKGTPQSLVDVLQYYGVTNVDIYEFFLKLYLTEDNLVFHGKSVAGTTLNAPELRLQFENLVSGDPHWLYTKEQILQLNQTNSINLPSKSPYIGVQPNVELDGPEMSLISRTVQDQYDYWETTGTLPPANAQLTEVGENRSFLELYLSCIYIFNELYSTGVEALRFTCYDGTSTTSTEILSEYEAITSGPFLSRQQIKDSYDQYIDEFTRLTSTNFLVDENTAENLLNTISPDLKTSLDLIADREALLFSLLKDLSLWVRTNIGYGFVNFGFILFGINEFFTDLKPVIDFFKPYRARLLLIEALQIKNRLFNKILVEDSMSFDIGYEFVDYITADSVPCCLDTTCSTITTCSRQFIITPPSDFVWKGLWTEDEDYAINDVVSAALDGKQYICIQAHEGSIETKPPTGTDWLLYWEVLSELICDSTATTSFYSRETFDCGSYFDIGSVIDRDEEPTIYIDEDIHEYLKCGRDGTGYVFSQILGTTYVSPEGPPVIKSISYDSTTMLVLFDVDKTSTDYIIGLTLENELPGATPIKYVVSYKSVTSFMVRFEDKIPDSYYNMHWFVLDDFPNSGIINLTSGSSEQEVFLSTAQDSTNYTTSVVLRNINNSDEMIPFNIQQKTSSSFIVGFSKAIPSSNYYMEWAVPDIKQTGYSDLQSSTITIPINELETDYPIIVDIQNPDAGNGGGGGGVDYDYEFYGVGEGANYLLGNGSTTHYSSPQLSLFTKWKSVGMGQNSSHGIKQDGTLWTWGANNYGELGDGTLVTKQVPTLVDSSNWKDVSCGTYHRVGIKSDGTLWGWGYNQYGQTGHGDQIYRSSPTQVGSDSDWAKCVCCNYYTVLLKNDGSLWSMGENSYGQLGHDDRIYRSSPTQIGSDTDWLDVENSAFGFYAIKSNGTIWGCGYNNYGQLGQEDIINRSSPVQIGTSTNWKSISSRSGHVLMINTSGELWGCGYNIYGQLGVEDIINRSSPTQVGSDINWSIAKSCHNCSYAQKIDGSLWSWGDNTTGQLGLGLPSLTSSRRSSPNQVGSDTNWVSINSGLNNENVLLLKENSVTTGVYVSGYNNYGQLGLNDTANRYYYQKLNSDEYITISSSSESSTMYLKSDGTLWGSGQNNYGKLGLGDRTNRSVLTQVGSETWKTVWAGQRHTASIKNNNTLWAWGYNIYGQLGQNNTTNQSSPVQIGSDTDWSQVSCGESHTMAIKNNGTLWGVGYNGLGQLGTGNTTNYSTLIQVGSDTNWSKVVAFYRTTIALKTDGTLWAWGANPNGELGQSDSGPAASRSAPIQIGSLTTWTDISALFYAILAKKSDGTLWAWGLNNYGQLGQGDIVNRSSPVQIGSDTDWDKIASGYQHSLATRTDGTLWAWGYNYQGSLSIPASTTSQSSPVLIGDVSIWSNVYAGLHSSYFVGTVSESGSSTYGQIYEYIVTNRTSSEFTVEVTPTPDSTGSLVLSWGIVDIDVVTDEFSYYQTGEFTDYDGGAYFDCIFGADYISIIADNPIAYLLQENGYRILQENGARILL